MKKLLTMTALTLLITASCANSQSLFGFGVKGGLVRAEQTWEYTAWFAENSDKKSIWGVDLGVYTEIVSISDFSLQVELHYVQKGNTVTVLETALANNPQGFIDLGPRDIKSRFHYLSVPVLIKFSPEVQVVRPFLTVGPSLECLVSRPSTSPTYDKYRSAELAATVSLGAEITFASIHTLSGEVRYVQGLTPSVESDAVTVKTSAVIFLLGVSF
jgi:hypothetical protein